MSESQRILGVVYEIGNFAPLLMVAKAGRERSAFSMILWAPYALPNGDRMRAEAEAVGSAYVEESTPHGSLADIHTVLSGWQTEGHFRRPVPGATPTDFHERILERLEPEKVVEVLRKADACERRIRFCEDWLVRLGIDVVLFAEDNVERDSYAWIEAARRRTVRTVVVSYGVLSSCEAEVAYAYDEAHRVDDRPLALFREYLPKWLREGDDYSITRIPYLEALAREMCGVSPFNPWLVNSQGVDCIALESESLDECYRAHGFDGKQLRAVGHPLHDSLWKVKQEKQLRREEISRTHGFDNCTPWIVVAMPPNQPGRASCFHSYEELLLTFGIIPSRVTRAAVVVSPHPTMTAEEKATLVSLGGHLEDTSVCNLLPLADLYIASVSSTIKWALGLGIPVIDFDCYGYDYRTYAALPQVSTVTTVEAFTQALRAWLVTGDRVAIEKAAADGAQRWGSIDGKAIERLLECCIGNPGAIP